MAKIIVLFEVTIKPDKMADYLNRAKQLKPFLQDFDGFISSERFTSMADENKLLSMSIWKDAKSVFKWRNFCQHRLNQEHGRNHDFVDYKITVVSPTRTYTLTNRDQAPDDSNQYFINK